VIASSRSDVVGRCMRMALAALGAAIIAALMFAGSAGATPPSLFDTPAADQYVESIPASDGPTVRGRKHAKTAPLPPGPSAALRRDGGDSASKLEQVATSSDYGAPQRRLRRGGDEGPPSVSSAAVSALGDDTGSDLRWLLIALLTSTGVLLGAAGYRYSQQRRPSS
jgi:hypothetical protein